MYFIDILLTYNSSVKLNGGSFCSDVGDRILNAARAYRSAQASAPICQYGSLLSTIDFQSFGKLTCIE